MLIGGQTLSLAKLSRQYLTEKLRCCSQSVVLLPRIVATGRCAKVLLNGLFFLPTPRNASFPSVDEVLIFQANKSSALYICPPICSEIAAAAVTGRKDFTAAVAVFFLFLIARCLDKASFPFSFPSPPLPFPFPLAPWPVFFSEPPELINFLAYLYYFSVIFSLPISHPPLRMRKLPQQCDQPKGLKNSSS